MRAVGADDTCREFALVAQLHFNAAIGACHDVKIGENVAGLVENESRSLALLRNGSIKEVEDQRGGGDVDHRGQHSFIYPNVVLFFGVVLRRGLGLSEFERRGGAAAAEQRTAPHGVRGLEKRSHRPESTQQKHKNEENAAYFHGSIPLKKLQKVLRRLVGKVPRTNLSRLSNCSDSYWPDLLLSAWRRGQRVCTWARSDSISPELSST